MQIHVIAEALAFCIFGLGLFLGAGVRPLLVIAMKSDPLLIGPVLTRMFSRYNIAALLFSGVLLGLEIIQMHSTSGIALAGTMTLILALKLPFDQRIASRETAAQVRGVGTEGRRLEILHKAMETATLLILLLSLGLFVLNVRP